VIFFRFWFPKTHFYNAVNFIWTSLLVFAQFVVATVDDDDDIGHIYVCMYVYNYGTSSANLQTIFNYTFFVVIHLVLAAGHHQNSRKKKSTKT
jgi:hypothetical protein